MADAVVSTADGRVKVVPFGSELLTPIVGLASGFADASEAWAEGTEPGGPGTKSAKDHAEDAAASAADALASLGSLPEILYGGTVNLFDANATTSGFEVYSDGSIQAEADSVVSDFMFVYGETSVTISGLQANPSIGRYMVFLAQNKTTVLGVAQMTGGSNSGTFAVPAGAWFMRFSPKQRNAAANNFATAQVEGGGAPTAYQAYVKRLAAVNGALVERVHLDFVGDRNLFDGWTIAGYEVYGDGTLSPQADSIITNPIDVQGASFVTISGLPANPSFTERYFRFLTINGVLISYASLGTALGGTLIVPGNAAFFQLSLKQREPTAVSFATVQIETGSSATAYQPYTPRVISINGNRIKQLAGGGSAAPWAGRNYLLFGDSITETADVDAGDYTITSGYRDNWPNYAMPLLDPLTVFNYAKSGAHFASLASGLTTFQKIEEQLNQAISDGRTPNVVIVSIGTNDIGSAISASEVIGDYATAMGKAIGSLDLTVGIEAARKAFYRIQDQWPTAKKFYCNPLQRADVDPDDMEAEVDLFGQMAARYGFEVIDAFREANIVADFEVNGGAGDDLYDGLHPAVAGRQKQGDLIAARVRARLVG